MTVNQPKRGEGGAINKETNEQNMTTTIYGEKNLKQKKGNMNEIEMLK